jgi:hypothetical protein
MTRTRADVHSLNAALAAASVRGYVRCTHQPGPVIPHGGWRTGTVAGLQRYTHRFWSGLPKTTPKSNSTPPPVEQPNWSSFADAKSPNCLCYIGPRKSLALSWVTGPHAPTDLPQKL